MKQLRTVDLAVGECVVEPLAQRLELRREEQRARHAADGGHGHVRARRRAARARRPQARRQALHHVHLQRTCTHRYQSQPSVLSSINNSVRLFYLFFFTWDSHASVQKVDSNEVIPPSEKSYVVFRSISEVTDGLNIPNAQSRHPQ